MWYDERKGGSGVERAEHYESDMLFFFDGRPVELGLYEVLFQRMQDAFPGASVKVQKSQISFYGRHLFAAASLPLRRKKGWPEQSLMVTFGLSHPLSSPRIAVKVEPYPDRWTHHVLVERPEEIDGELMGWLQEAWTFAETKGPSGRKRRR